MGLVRRLHECCISNRATLRGGHMPMCSNTLFLHALSICSSSSFLCAYTTCTPTARLVCPGALTQCTSSQAQPSELFTPHTSHARHIEYTHSLLDSQLLAQCECMDGVKDAVLICVRSALHPEHRAPTSVFRFLKPPARSFLRGGNSSETFCSSIWSTSLSARRARQDSLVDLAKMMSRTIQTEHHSARPLIWVVAFAYRFGPHLGSQSICMRLLVGSN